jgi:hypothetical protein
MVTRAIKSAQAKRTLWVSRRSPSGDGPLLDPLRVGIHIECSACSLRMKSSRASDWVGLHPWWPRESGSAHGSRRTMSGGVQRGHAKQPADVRVREACKLDSTGNRSCGRRREASSFSSARERFIASSRSRGRLWTRFCRLITLIVPHSEWRAHHIGRVKSMGRSRQVPCSTFRRARPGPPH